MKNTEDKPKITPIEDLKQKALEHYEELANKCSSYNSFVVKCIKEYTEKQEPAKGLTPDMVLPNDEEYERIIKGNSEKVTDSEFVKAYWGYKELSDITPADIEVWANETSYNLKVSDMTVSDVLQLGAKAALNNEIPKIK